MNTRNFALVLSLVGLSAVVGCGSDSADGPGNAQAAAGNSAAGAAGSSAGGSSAGGSTGSGFKDGEDAYVRFAVLVSNTDGANFDICLKKAGAANYEGPFANKFASGASLVGPEFTNYFKGDDFGAKIGDPINVRLVKPGDSCGDGTKDHPAYFDVVDDANNKLHAGYNTIFIYGDHTPGTGKLKTTVAGDGPATLDENYAYIRFFNGLLDSPVSVVSSDKYLFVATPQGQLATESEWTQVPVLPASQGGYALIAAYTGTLTFVIDGGEQSKIDLNATTYTGKKYTLAVFGSAGNIQKYLCEDTSDLASEKLGPDCKFLGN